MNTCATVSQLDALRQFQEASQSKIQHGTVQKIAETIDIQVEPTPSPNNLLTEDEIIETTKED